MIRLSKNEYELYGRATRVFVDYEKYSQEECVSYYRILEHLNEGREIYNSNYLISGIEEIIRQTDFAYKDIFMLRFIADNCLSVYDIAEQIGITKQGLLLRYEEAYKYIRNQVDKYDIAKRLAMLKGAMEQLQMIRDEHSSKCLTKTVGIETLGLRPRAYNCLKSVGIDTVAQFACLNVAQIKSIPGVGPRTFEDIVKSQKRLIDDASGLKYPETTLSLDSLGLGERAKRCLKHLNVKTLEDFMRLSKEDVMGVWHAGEKTWKEIFEKQHILKLGRV